MISSVAFVRADVMCREKITSLVTPLVVVKNELFISEVTGLDVYFLFTK